MTTTGITLRHRVFPEEAEQVITGEPYDLERRVVDGELRYSQLGETRAGHILVVVIIWRLDRIRVVTAWDAPQALKRKYLALRVSRWNPRF